MNVQRDTDIEQHQPLTLDNYPNVENSGEQLAVPAIVQVSPKAGEYYEERRSSSVSSSAVRIPEFWRRYLI